MHFTEADIFGLTETVVGAVLGLPIETDARPPTAGCGEALESGVDIDGGWHGTVAVRAHSQFVRLAASIMFRIEPDAVGPDDLADALGELANMIGGNLKGLLSEPSRLSLPRMAAAREGEGGDTAAVCLRVAMLSDGLPIEVILRERTAGLVNA